ncbi:unnamed protein product, partial [Mesorhabditis spiculigera]
MRDPMPGFSEMVDAMLGSFVLLMSEEGERMPMQNTALRHLPSAIPHLAQVFDSTLLTHRVVHIINAFGPKIVEQERLQFIGKIVESDLFLDTNSRSKLFKVCIAQLLSWLDHEEIESRETAKSAIAAGRILGTMLDRLWPLTGFQEGYADELALILEYCSRPLIRSLYLISQYRAADLEISEGRGLLFAVILAIFNRISDTIFLNFLATRRFNQDRMDVILELLQMLRDCLGKSPYPQTWAQMTLAQNRVVHKALRLIHSAISRFFPGESVSTEFYDLAQGYLLTVVCFINQIMVNRNGEPSREDEQAAHLQRQATNEIRSMWTPINMVHKVQKYTHRLIGSFLQVALIPDEEIRETMIVIFVDMLECEHALKGSEGIKKFSDEFVAQLDRLVMKGHGTRSFRNDLVKSMMSHCKITENLPALSEEDRIWRTEVDAFIDRIRRLLGHLFEYRDAKDASDCIEIEMSRTVQLMKFYNSLGLADLHIAYVYKLYELHSQYGNDIEAANTLLMHAEKLKWTEAEVPGFLVKNSLNRHCATERQLKENLSLNIADLFSRGDMWENSIEMLRQLQEVYYSMDYDYDKMAELLIHQADLFKKIGKENRAFFYFYLVAFYGNGYPPFLNGKKFVFRSDQLERHPDFLQRMKQMYGNPETYTTMDDCSHLQNGNGRHLQIFKVDPIPRDVAIGQAVNPAIKDYYRNYNIQSFEYIRIHGKKETKWTELEDNEMLRTWVTRRVVHVEEPLPSALRFSHVEAEPVPEEISPLALAVQGMKNKNERLIESAQKVLHNPLFSIRNFAGDVQGVVQASVMGGVKNYEVFFSDACAAIIDDEERRLCDELRELIVEQVSIVEYCIYAHGTRAEADKNIHNFLIEGFREHKGYVDRKFGQTTSRLPAGASIYNCAVEPLPNPGLGEKEKKPSSTSLGAQMFAEDPNNSSFTSQSSIITAGSNTLKKGFQKYFNSGPRKSFSSLSGVVIKQAEKPAEMFDRVMKTDQVEQLKRYVKNHSPINSPQKRHNSQSSLDTSKIRLSGTPKSPMMPPTPPSTGRMSMDEQLNNSDGNGNGTLTKKAMKPLPPISSDV